mgnify:CR=1 FL=1
MYFCNHIKIHVAFELVSYAPAHFFDPSVLRIIGGLVLPFAQSALEGKGEDGRVIILEFTSMCTYRSHGCDYISAFYVKPSAREHSTVSSMRIGTCVGCDTEISATRS